MTTEKVILFSLQYGLVYCDHMKTKGGETVIGGNSYLFILDVTTAIALLSVGMVFFVFVGINTSIFKRKTPKSENAS